MEFWEMYKYIHSVVAFLVAAAVSWAVASPQFWESYK